MTAPLTRAEVEALPDLGPWHAACCSHHSPGGKYYGPDYPAPSCYAVRDVDGRRVREGEKGRRVLDLYAAAPDLRATALALYAEVGRLQGEAFCVFGEQMRAEGERDAARRELAEIREALGDLVGAAGSRTLAETVASLARFATETTDRLTAVSGERDRLRALAYPSPLPLAEAAGDGPAMLWWRSAPIQEPPCYIGHPGDSGWPFTDNDAPIWVPLPEIANDSPEEPKP